MLTLVLIRHAKSLHDDYVKRDIERHLAPRGYADAELTGVFLARQKFKNAVYFSSPAIRAFTTALIVAECNDYPLEKIKLKEEIYEASTKRLVKLISEFDDDNKTICMFGHNPGFTDLVNHLCGPVINDLSTSGAAIISFDVDSWSEISGGSGKLKEIYSTK